MKPIHIGYRANGKKLYLTPEMRKSTHMHVIGGSGKGKSKLLEWLQRQDIDEGHGFTFIDWHGKTYYDILRYCCQLDVGTPGDWRKLILINPSLPDFITGFNPFMNQGLDVTVQVKNRIAATIRPWGMTDTTNLPTFRRVCDMLYTFAVEQQEPLPNTSLLLDYKQSWLRDYAIHVLTSRRAKREWERLQMMKSFRDWDATVLSTENRLGPFLGSTAVRRFMGLAEGNINLREIMDKGYILLVNLGASPYLDREAAKVFASLLLNEFFETAMVRANEASEQSLELEPHTLYLDEFQQYVTQDTADMLDEVRKGGLQMVLAHQNLGQIINDPHLLDSLMGNARIRVALGGLPVTNAKLLAEEMFLSNLNAKQIRKAHYGITHVYKEETRTSYGRTESESYGEGDTWADGETVGDGESSGTARSNSIGRSRGQTKSEGTGYSEGESDTIGSGWSWGHSSNVGQSSSESSGFGKTSGRSQGMGWPGEGGPQDEAEGWFTEGAGEGTTESGTYGTAFSTTDTDSESESESMSTTHSSTQSWSSAESESESESESFSIGESASESHFSSLSKTVGGSSSESESYAETETEIPVWVPIPIRELRGIDYYSLDDKRSMAAEALINQQQRFAFIKCDTEETEPLGIPFVRDYPQFIETFTAYQRLVFQTQKALPAADVDQLIDESEIKFLTRAREYMLAQQAISDSAGEPVVSETSSAPAKINRRTVRTKPQPKPKPGSHANNANKNNPPTDDDV